jgi:hypothetical protein
LLFFKILKRERLELANINLLLKIMLITCYFIKVIHII